ncbi:MAG: exodeoxyribonuclease VII large subunit [Glaciecola sp.]
MFAVPQEIKIISVTKLNHFAKQVLESEIGQVWVSGEISNLTKAASGHWYFTLKDNKAQVRTAMFKGANQKLSFIPKHGDKVVVRANLSLYEARGDYQLIAVHMEPEGVGQLKQAFEALKLQLQDEGLFAQSAKQALPTNITKIGLVTSATGAAVHDILHVLQRRNPAIEVIIYPSMVQGDGAASSIVQQIQNANRRNEVDVLIVGRGGGSLEDLWSFNEEVVARAIFDSQLPVVSAVGHEVDVTISDFVADMRAATPSAAAELLSEDTQRLQQNINDRKRSLMRALQYQLSQKQQQQQNLHERLDLQHPQKTLLQQQQSLDYLLARLHAQHPQKHIEQQQQAANRLEQRLYAKHPSTVLTQHNNKVQQLQMRLSQSLNKRLQQTSNQQGNTAHKLYYLSPKNTIKQHIERVNVVQANLAQAIKQQLKDKQHSLQGATGMLNTVSPLATMSRGYSITLKDDALAASVHAVNVGDEIKTKLADGEVISTVSSTHVSEVKPN